MNEIEIKLKVDSFDGLREKLSMAGFEMKKKDIETAIFFDDDSGSLSEKGVTVRIKKGSGWSSFAVKQKRQDEDYKIADEHQVDISDAEEISGALKLLGFQKKFEYKKEREHWENNDLVVELDNISDIGVYFVEVEAGSGEAIEGVIMMLGLQGAEREKRSYPDIVKEAVK
jgi:adenylate cyclase class 2